MSELIDDPVEGENAPEFTVSEISGAVKKTIEGAFGRVRVRGEVGRIFKARSGHLYYDIKDDKNVLACTTWKGQVSQLSVVPEEGLEVIVTGRLTAFGAQSKYNLNVDMVEVAGEGALMAMLEKRKKALAAEGLFAPERKQKLPYLPEVIGVITSPSGAVIQDILHRLRDRFPRKVLIWPVAVQGKQCASEVTRAIEGFNAMTPGGALPRPDLLIVARGGGSIEDLWGFNEENVARASAASDIPLISAVGHETDTTLIDFVSDQRAPTPTAAAELAVPVRLELLAWVDDQDARLTRAAIGAVDQRKQRLRDLARALPNLETLLDTPRQRLDRASERLPAALARAAQIKRLRLSEASGSLRPAALVRLMSDAKAKLFERGNRLQPTLLARDIERKKTDITQISARLARVSQGQIDGWRSRLDALERIRQTLGYKETLMRGYAVVRGDGDVITSKAKAKKAGVLEIEFQDGRYKIGAAPVRKAKPKETPPDQGSLF